MHDPGRINDGGVLAPPSRLPVLVQPQIQVVHPDLHRACGTPLAFYNVIGQRRCALACLLKQCMTWSP